MKVMFFCLSIMLSTFANGSSINPFNAILALDTEDRGGETYKSFRTTKDSYIAERVAEIESRSIRILDLAVFEKEWEALTPEDKAGVVWTSIPTREGLDRQHVSGSGQFGGKGFVDIVKRIREMDFEGGIVVVDHREEPHGFLTQGVPFSLYGRSDAFSLGKTWAELERVESKLIGKVAKNLEVFLHEITDKEKDLVTGARLFAASSKEAYSEKYLVKDLNGCGYVRIGITDHHRAMDDDLDDVIKYFDAFPLGTWKHFHCRGGKGRTTTGMALFDILSNHGNGTLSFQDIMIRQYLIGGSNLLAVPTTDPEKTWKAKAAYDRIRTIYKFYQKVNGQQLTTRQFYANEPEFKDSASTDHAYLGSRHSAKL